MSVPSGTKFIGIASNVDTLERKSALANSPSQVYTIGDIAEAVTTEQDSNILWTVDMVDALSVTIYAPYDMSINSSKDVYVTSPYTLTITVNGSPYSFEDQISIGDAIEFSVDEAAVINFGVSKL